MVELRDWDFKVNYFNHKKIKDIKGNVADLLVRVASIKPIYSIEAKGQSIEKRPVILEDDTAQIRAVLWKDHALDPEIQEGAVIAVKDAFVIDYNGK